MEREKSIELLADLETTKVSLQRMQEEIHSITQTKVTLNSISERIIKVCDELDVAVQTEEKIFNEVHNISVTETLNKLKEMSDDLRRTNSDFSDKLDNTVSDLNNSLADNKNSFENQLQSLVSNNNDFLEKMRLILDKNISDLNNAINSIKLDNAKTINDLRDLLDKKTSETMGEMKRFNKRIAITSLVFTIVGFLCGVIALVIALMK